MSWIPDIPPLFLSLQRIESEEDLLKDSVDLFWLFCNSLMNPEQFTDRMEFWKRMVEKDKPKGGGFIDSELEAIMLKGFNDPDKAVQIMLEKFESAVESKSVEYIPDSVDPVISIYVYLHLEAARLFRVIKVQGYSDITRESLDKAANALNRCYKALEDYPQSPWQWDYSISLEAVASFINTTKFFILKIDGKYEEALISLSEGLENIQESYSIFDNNRRPIFKSGLHFYHMSFSKDLRITVPWMENINQQLFVDCFEAIRKGNQIRDTRKLLEICESFLAYSDEPWLSNNRPDNNYTIFLPEYSQNEINNSVETEEYEYDHPIEYWREVIGWVEAQITPSDLKNMMNEREEEAAEKRLRGYFFEETIWERISDRAKKSLISADRDWFSGTNIRNEAILGQLAIATEEILYYEFWLKLEKWNESADISISLQNEFNITKQELISSRSRSKLRVLAEFCRGSLAEKYLSANGIEHKDKDWFQKKLPGKIHDLYNQRNIAEHESAKSWTRDEIGKYFREFIGIGTPGIFLRLTKILLLITD